MIDRARRALDRFFAPQWAGGWVLARWLWVLAATVQCGFDVLSIPDVWGARDMLFASGPFRLTEYFTMTPTMAYAIWALMMTGIALVARGGRAMRPGLLLWTLCTWTFLGYEALNVKAHDRLLAWLSIALFVSPAHERGLTTAYRDPFARYLVYVIMAAIYGGTGWNKALHEPSWFGDGSVLALHFLHVHHGSKPLSVWLSGQTWLHPFMTWFTVIWEAGFPLFVLIPRLNPWVLAMGIVFHVALLFTMNVGPFAFVSLIAYPVLLHPEFARRCHLRWTALGR